MPSIKAVSTACLASLLRLERIYFWQVNEAEINELLRSAEEINAKKWQIPVYFYPNLTPHEIRLYYSGSHFEPETFAQRCIHPWMASYIYPDGSVLPCHTLGYSPGNVRQDKFTKIWNNANTEATENWWKDLFGPYAPNALNSTDINDFSIRIYMKILHIITRLDRGGSADIALLTAKRDGTKGTWSIFDKRQDAGNRPAESESLVAPG